MHLLAEGHSTIEIAERLAKITPIALAKAYDDAGYFARNIEVLVDRDAVTSGAAAAGEPWQYYDMGHGYCTYTFFEQCPHRMACARCDFYTPKNSSKGQLLEAKDNLQRMLVARLAHPLYGEVWRTAMGRLRARRLRGLVARTLDEAPNSSFSWPATARTTSPEATFSSTAVSLRSSETHRSYPDFGLGNRSKKAVTYGDTVKFLLGASVGRTQWARLLAGERSTVGRLW